MWLPAYEVVATKNTKFINYVCNLLVRMEISKQCYMHMVAEKCFKSTATAAMVPPQITGCVRVSEYSNGYKIIMIYCLSFLPIKKQRNEFVIWQVNTTFSMRRQ